MAQVYLFQCSKCKSELVGPLVVTGRPLPKIGSTYVSGSPVACKGLCKILGATIVYQGVGDRIPNAPAMLQGKTSSLPKIPMKWTQASPDAPYVRSALFNAIPAVPQAALIAELDGFFEENEISLLSAMSDRFDADLYSDILDSRIVAGADSAEKHLTTVMVLTRLNAVLNYIDGSKITWAVSKIDRPQFAPGCNLTLPARINHAGTTYRFHLEVLNDLVNPREGHALLPDIYFSAICKAIELANAGSPVQTVQGPKDGYYFWCSKNNRGINVVLKRDTKEILTVYYCNSVAAWWVQPSLSAQLKLERTIGETP